MGVRVSNFGQPNWHMRGFGGGGVGCRILVKPNWHMRGWGWGPGFWCSQICILGVGVA